MMRDSDVQREISRLTENLQVGAERNTDAGEYEIGTLEDAKAFARLRDSIDYHEAVKQMHLGKVVKYVGTVNGNVMTDRGHSFCMCRGCIFLFDTGVIKWNKLGYMVYDPDFRYELTGETVDPRAWDPENNRDRKEIRSKLGYSRIGRNNV